jgi:hypothetical protein
MRRAAYMTVMPARAQRPLSTLEHTERAVTVACARKAASVARPVVSGYDTNHGKVFAVSTQGARRTCLTWLRAPTQSKESG